MGMTNESDLYRDPYMMSSTYCKRCCSNSQSIFTPLKSKMKNIRKRIGLGSNLHSPICSQRSLPPVRFSPVHGENITLNKDRSIARRSNSFCKAITFSDRPIKVGEKIYIKFIELSDAWSGSIRFGFTTRNPGTLKGQLPKYMCPDLTNEKGFWGKAVNEREYAYMNNTMYFYVSKSGNVYCGIEGRSKELLFDHVDVSRHLWMAIDVYGNTMAIELVSLQLNNTINADQEAGFGVINNIRTTGSLDSVLENNFSCMSLRNDSSPSYTYVDSSLSNNITDGVTTSWEKLKNVKRPQEARKVPHNLVLTPLPFHDKHGVNIRLSNDRLSASRLEREFSKGYVFSPRAIGPNEFVVVQILKTENSYAGGMAFGMTTKNPATIDPLYLPEDSDNLLDSADSFYIHKNVANSPNEGDILIFSLNEEGEVRMKKNSELQMTVFHVERNLPYWWFFDLYGSTMKIRAYSGDAEKPSSEIIRQGCSITGSSQQSCLPYVPVNNTDRPVEMNIPLPLPVSVPQASIYGNAPILVLNCSINGNRSSFEPLKIVIQNQADGRSSQIIASPQETSQVVVRTSVDNYESINTISTVPRKQNEAYDCSEDNGKNREHHLQEWVKTTWRNAPHSPTQNDCIVCYERPVDCVLYRCGHMCMCYECARELWRGRGDGHCPYCRAVIRDVVRTYKS